MPWATYAGGLSPTQATRQREQRERRLPETSREGEEKSKRRMPAEADEADECMAIENMLEECASHAGDHVGERVESRSPWHDGRYRYTKYLLALQACRKAEREGIPHAGGSSVPTECGRVEKSPHRRVQDRLPVLGPLTTVSSPEHAIGRKKQTNNNKQTTQFGEQFLKKECTEGGRKQQGHYMVSRWGDSEVPTLQVPDLSSPSGKSGH